MKLHELKALRASKVDELKALAQKDMDSDSGLDDAEATQFDTIKTSIAALDTRIGRLEDAIAADSDTAEPASDDDAKSLRPQHVVTRATGRSWAEPSSRVPEQKGFKLARYVMGLRMAKEIGRADAAQWIENRFGDREVAKALSISGGATVGGNLIPAYFSSELIELLRPAVAVRSLNPASFDLTGGNLVIPRQTSSATAQYQGELTPIPVSQLAVDQLTLTAKKLTAFTAVSNDLVRRSPLNVETLVRDDLVQTIARREDLAFMRGDGSSGTPTGLLSLAPTANKFTAAGVTLANATSLVVQMVAAMQNANSRMLRPGWIMNPTTRWFLSGLRDGVGNFVFKQELDANTFYGYPVRLTTAIPGNLTSGGGTHGAEIYLADFADVIVADTLNVSIDMSDVASFVDGSSVQHNSFQEDMSVFRVITEHDFNMRHLGSVAVGFVDSWTP
jgi:HK97 family phage major capsid protein